MFLDKAQACMPGAAWALQEHAQLWESSLDPSRSIMQRWHGVAPQVPYQALIG